MFRVTGERFLRTAWAVARKDFRIEARGKQALPMAVALSLLVVVVFAFAGEGPTGSGPLWVAFVFAGTVGVMQSVAVEGENDAIDGLLLTPIPHSAVFVGKVLSGTAFVAGIGAVTLFASWFLLGAAPVASPGVVLGTVLLFAVGFAAAAVVVSAIAVYTEVTAFVVPVLLVPVLIPALVAGIELLGGGGVNWAVVLGSYDGIVFLTGLLVFDELLV